jgi:prepilin-type N-terminal cleavage/methylation domain-containing protein
MSKRRSGRGRSRSPAGFSLLEMMAVIAISLTMASIAGMSFVGVMKTQRVVAAYNDTLGTMRRARDQAAGDMRAYVVTFANNGANPSTITVAQASTTVQGCVIPPTGSVLLTTILPYDITFQVEPNVPTSETTAPTTPDGFGTAANAIDFGYIVSSAETSVCFNPDGTATDGNGNQSSGVVYLGRTGDTYSARAITLWGSTGRIRGWRLYNVSGKNKWSQQ